jgi:hypothetical protein
VTRLTHTRKSVTLRLVCLLLAGCATLQRTPVPRSDTPVVVVVTGSMCPAYLLALHEDGLVEYWADATARASGTGWLRVDPMVVERLRRTRLVSPQPIIDIDADGWCRVSHISANGLAINGHDGWKAQCEAQPEREAEVLRMLGVVDWLLPRP